ncbi:hypothetical protein BH11MYX3_BH11MYX3_07080 [soil metagenome]
MPARDDARVDTTIPPDVSPVTWTVDATSGKAVPANASEWRDFLKAKGLGDTVMAPSGLWLSQEASGPLADSIGTIVLQPLGAGHLYAQTVPGWSRKAIGTVDGSVTSFRNETDPGLPNVMSSSMTVLTLMSLPSGPPAGPRTMLVEGSSSPLAYAHADLDAAKHLVMAISATTASGTQDPGTAAAGLMMKLDVTHSQQKLITRKESVTLSTTPLASSRGLFVGGAVNPAPTARYLYVVAWYGARAEISDADATALLTALDW